MRDQPGWNLVSWSVRQVTAARCGAGLVAGITGRGVRSLRRYTYTLILFVIVALVILERANSLPANFHVRQDECLKRLFSEPRSGSGTNYEFETWTYISSDPCGRDILFILAREGVSTKILKVLVSFPEDYNSQEFFPKDKFNFVKIDEECDMVRQVMFHSVTAFDSQNGDPLSQLQGLQISPILEPILWLHPVRYKFFIMTPYTESIYRFLGPGYPRSVVDSLHPLDAWAQETLLGMGLSCSGPDLKE